MQAQIIHNPFRIDRMANIIHQALEQEFEYRIWPHVADANPIRGCHLAHRAIVQHAKDFNWPSVWIMEDDVMFTTKSAAEQWLKLQPHAMDIYSAGNYGTHKYRRRGDKYDLPYSISGTHCYIVYQQFYDKFLSMDENEHLDVQISQTSERIVIPKLIYALQQSGYSDILQQQVNYNNEKYLSHELFKG